MGLLTKNPLRGIYNQLHGKADNFVLDLVGSGAPTSGASGTGVNQAGPGSTYTNISNGLIYVNTNTKASPTWSLTTAAMLGVTAGVVSASAPVVVDANKAVDYSRATTERDLGGTTVPGAALVCTEFVKEVTGIADATATAVLTVTVPNAAHACRIEIDVLGRLGAGGAIGADEVMSSSKYIVSIVRTAGVASVGAVSAQLGVASAAVAGATTATAVITQTATGEGVGVTNTHIIKITITKGGGSSANHKCDLFVRVFNANASGVTVA